nr:hypothetical protein [Providencia rustigianii]
MSEVTSDNKKVVELVINGAPVSFYDVNNGNTIGALSFLNKVIETLAGENVGLLDEAIVSQFTIDAKDIGKLETRTIASGEVALNPTAENEGQKALPYGDEPFVYTACLDLDGTIFWLEQQLELFNSQRRNINYAEIVIKDLKRTIASINQNHDLIKIQRHRLESNLLKDSSQYAHNLKMLLLFLNNPEFQQKNFPGINLLRE